ncbi:protein translocase subunit SecD [Candidatus Uhrbacteria bacterium]|nr:protein translocase subunit SecD [Candidatus Uhrbacteria bacterium]
MQTWKLKRKTARKPKSPWGRRIVGIILLVLTVLFYGYDFPMYWNRAVNAAHLPASVRLSENAFRLGLDLQGGTHLVYDADMSQIPESERADALEGVKNVIERRVNAFGVSEPVVQTTTTGGTYRLIIELAGIQDVKQAIDQIGKTPVLEFKEPAKTTQNDLSDDQKTAFKQANAKEREAAQTVLGRTLKGENFDGLITENSRVPLEKSTLEHITGNSPYGDFQIVIEKNHLKPGRVYASTLETDEGINIFRYEKQEPAEEMQLGHVLVCFEGKERCSKPIPQIEANTKIQQLKSQATPEGFSKLEGYQDLGWGTVDRYVEAFATAASALKVGSISDVIESPFGYHLIYKQAQRTVPSYTVKRILMPLTTETDVAPQGNWLNTTLSGKQLKRATVQFDQKTNVPNVVLDFNSEGADLFGKLTERLVGQQIAIFLDGVPVSAPVVQQAIYGGQAVITGNFTLDEAKLLAQNLNAGALPVPINLLSQQTVGPTLGSISLAKSVSAALIGFLLVALFMLIAYRLPGLIAVVALGLFVSLNMAAYRFFDVTITLAGIAGLVLSIGIAVDANVLIFARMKEEFAAGRDFQSAIDEGFTRAWTAIRDGHLTTLIAAAVLYWFSSSFIRGFALTLSVGVVLSLFTAITVTRVYLRNVTAWKWARHPVLFGNKKPTN